MKCFLTSVKAQGADEILKSYPYFEICDYFHTGICPNKYNKPEKQLYIEGDEKHIIETLKDIANIIKRQFIVTFRDDGDMEAEIYDDYIQRE